VAVPCLPRRRSPDTISRPPTAPADRREPSQFTALTARKDEVAPRAGPLRAIAERPQVALPARRALLTSASLTGAHLPTVTRHPAVPMVTRPAGRHMPAPGWGPAGRRSGTSAPGATAPRHEVRPQQDIVAAFPASGEQRSVSSCDRRTPTFHSTLRDPGFDSGEARMEPPFGSAASADASPSALRRTVDLRDLGRAAAGRGTIR
jgi:hypothetical protein